MATIVRCLLLVALLIAVVSAGLRGQEVVQEEPEQQRLLQQTPIQPTQNCPLSDLSRSSFLQPAFSSLPTSYTVEFALQLNPDTTTTGFTGILRLSDNRQNLASAGGLFVRLPGVYLCPGTGYPAPPGAPLCTAPYQLYLSYVGIAGTESVAVASPALVPNILYRVVISVDRTILSPPTGVRVTMSVYLYNSASLVSTAALPATTGALDNNAYPFTIVAAYPPATLDGNGISYPPANVFFGCPVFSQTTFAPTVSPTPKSGPTPVPTPVWSTPTPPKLGSSSGSGPAKSPPKKPSPKFSEVLQNLVDTEDLESTDIPKLKPKPKTKPLPTDDQPTDAPTHG